MARPLRNNPPCAIQHIVNRGNRRAVIFHKPGDYDAFVEVMRQACHRSGMRVIAYSVMPNHWHIVLWPPENVSVSAFMQWLTSTHVRRYHAHYQSVGSGHIYQARYRNHVCVSERRLLAMIRYVEANPLAAKLVTRAREWKWSSLWMRLHGGEENFLTPCPIELPSNWPDYVDDTTRRKGKPTDCTSAESSVQHAEA